MLFFAGVLDTRAGSGIIDGTLLKSPQHTAVYQYEGGKRRAFPNSEVYHTWYDSFSNIYTISVAEMEAIEIGNPMPIKGYTKLLKFPLNPKIYSVTKDGIIHHIPDAMTAKSWYGENWGNEIIELPEIYYLFYTKGDILDSVIDSSDNPVDTSNDASIACPSGTIKKTYTNFGFTVCHDEDGAMTGLGNSIVFSVVSGSNANNFPGILTMVESGYDTAQDYIDFLNFGLMQMPLVEKNLYGVEYNSFSGGTVNSTNYNVIIQNPETKKIYHFYYPQNGSEESNAIVKDFMDDIRDTFRFVK